MKSEIRKYKIKGFRDDETKIRVLLEPQEIIIPKDEGTGMTDMLKNPMGVAQKLMQQGMSKMINDSFSISKEEYQNKKYMVGEIIFVTIERE